MNLIEAARNLLKSWPIEHEVISQGMVVNDKHYEELMLRRDETEFRAGTRIRPRPPRPQPMIVPRLPPPMSWGPGIPFIYAACTTAEDYPYPIQPMTEILTNPFEDWVCEWCGNMWASDIKSCEKCGGPKQVTV